MRQCVVGVSGVAAWMPACQAGRETKDAHAHSMASVHGDVCVSRHKRPGPNTGGRGEGRGRSYLPPQLGGCSAKQDTRSATGDRLWRTGGSGVFLGSRRASSGPRVSRLNPATLVRPNAFPAGVSIRCAPRSLTLSSFQVIYSPFFLSPRCSSPSSPPLPAPSALPTSPLPAASTRLFPEWVSPLTYVESNTGAKERRPLLSSAPTLNERSEEWRAINIANPQVIKPGDGKTFPKKGDTVTIHCKLPRLWR